MKGRKRKQKRNILAFSSVLCYASMLTDKHIRFKLSFWGELWFPSDEEAKTQKAQNLPKVTKLINREQKPWLEPTIAQLENEYESLETRVLITITRRGTFYLNKDIWLKTAISKGAALQCLQLFSKEQKKYIPILPFTFFPSLSSISWKCRDGIENYPSSLKNRWIWLVPWSMLSDKVSPTRVWWDLFPWR